MDALQNILTHAHSGLRYLILILLIVSIYTSLTKKGNDSFSASDLKTYMFTMIFTHVQFLIGMALFFITGRYKISGEVMKDSIARFYAVEHTAMMILAVILITIGYSKSKKADTVAGKHKSIALFYSIALVIILAAIPWPFRGLGASWF